MCVYDNKCKVQLIALRLGGLLHTDHMVLSMGYNEDEVALYNKPCVEFFVIEFRKAHRHVFGGGFGRCVIIPPFCHVTLQHQSKTV